MKLSQRSGIGWLYSVLWSRALLVDHAVGSCVL